jgi:pyruvate ferredoxin oxidoreductase gamma subunit
VKLGSLDKSLQVIEALQKNPQGLSIAELSQLLAFPASTVHHILSTFRCYDYVAQNPETKKYSLGFRFLSISTTILDNLDVRKTAYTHLRKLHRKCNEAIHLSILRNGQVTYVDKIQSSGGLSLATYIGFSTDPHAAAGGKILLSELPPSEVRAVYKDRPLKKYGKNTITNMGQLLEELENIRKQGYAIDNLEHHRLDLQHDHGSNQSRVDRDRSGNRRGNLVRAPLVTESLLFSRYNEIRFHIMKYRYLLEVTMREICIHGRGGQGSLVLAQFMAIAALEDGKYGSAFPFLGGGGERRGKPIVAFCRLSDRPIRTRSRVSRPDYVIVQDATIFSEVNLLEGIKHGGLVLVNTEKSREDMGLPEAPIRIITFAADKVARKILGRPIMNTALLGAFAAVTKELSLEAALRAVRSRFPGDLGEKNVQAVQESYKSLAEVR